MIQHEGLHCDLYWIREDEWRECVGNFYWGILKRQVRHFSSLPWLRFVAIHKYYFARRQKQMRAISFVCLASFCSTACVLFGNSDFVLKDDEDEEKRNIYFDIICWLLDFFFFLHFGRPHFISICMCVCVGRRV